MRPARPPWLLNTTRERSSGTKSGSAPTCSQRGAVRTHRIRRRRRRGTARAADRRTARRTARGSPRTSRPRRGRTSRTPAGRRSRTTSTQARARPGSAAAGCGASSPTARGRPGCAGSRSTGRRDDAPSSASRPARDGGARSCSRASPRRRSARRSSPRTGRGTSRVPSFSTRCPLFQKCISDRAVKMSGCCPRLMRNQRVAHFCAPMMTNVGSGHRSIGIGSIESAIESVGILDESGPRGYPPYDRPIETPAAETSRRSDGRSRIA